MNNLKITLPEISYIIPAHNRINFLKKTISSIYAQINTDPEIIVIDDNSQSIIEKKLNKLYPKIIFLRNNKNMGPSFSRNKGLEIASADIVCFLDSDDTLNPKFSKEMIKQVKLRKLPILCASKVLGESNSLLFFKIINFFRNIIIFYLYYMNHKKLPEKFFFIASPSRIAMPKAVAKEFLFNESMRQCEDWEICLRIMNKYAIFLYPKKLVNFRFHSGSESNIQRKNSGLACYTEMIKKLSKKHINSLPIIAFRAYIALLKRINE